MNCPNCSAGMTALTLGGHQGRSVAIDLCEVCQGFWFDRYESLQLGPASTLQLMKMIGERSSSGPKQFQNPLPCPRCSQPMRLTKDMQRTTRFSYFRCPNEHGRFIRFFEFLREKNFIRPLTAEQIDELRKHIQVLNCSSCGAPIDLGTGSSCGHCGSPVSMLDMKQSEELIQQLQKAAEPKPVNPVLAFDLVKARREMEILYAGIEPDANWLRDASSDLVHTCLASVARWLNKSGLS